MAVSTSIQDRTSEFHSVLTQVQKQRHTNKIGAQRQSLLSNAQKADNAPATAEKPRRSEFARHAAEIGRGISGTMAKLEKLAQRATSPLLLLSKTKTKTKNHPANPSQSQSAKPSSTTAPSKSTS